MRGIEVGFFLVLNEETVLEHTLQYHYIIEIKWHV